MKNPLNPNETGPSSAYPKPSLIGQFARHPNAANLLMVLLLIFGLFSLNRINTQFFPSISFETIVVVVSWPGASAEDVEANILAAAEPQLRFLDDVTEITSAAREGGADIVLTYEPGTDMSKAEADVKTALDGVSTFPADSEDPVINVGRFFDSLARINLSGPFPESSLRVYAKRIRDDLLERGIDKISFTGLRDEEIQVDLKQRDLQQLGLTIENVSQRIGQNSRDLPSGDLSGGVDKQLRTITDVSDPSALGEMEVRTFETGERILLKDIADISRSYKEDDVQGLVNGVSAIQINAQRSANSDTLKLSAIVEDYIAEIRPTLPPTLEVDVLSTRSDALLARISLLVKNGLSGLLLVVIILYIFLNARIAFWVTFGIPVAVAATLGVMFVTGQTINMLSLFALLMMLGIIVDDAIVVGEHTATRLAAGDPAPVAAEEGAGRMILPVVAASLTTAASFAPIFLIGDTIGKFMQVLPLVVLSVLLASLIECFFILPGHLAHSLAPRRKRRWSTWRQFLFGIFFAGLFVLVVDRDAAVTRAFMEAIANAGDLGGEERIGISGLLSGFIGGLLITFGWLAEKFILAGQFAAGLVPERFSAAPLAVLAMLISTAIEVVIYLLSIVFASRKSGRPPFLRRFFDGAFSWFRDKPFAALVSLSYRARYVTCAISISAIMVLAYGLISSGKVGFQFFPSPEAETINANIVFNAGIPRERARQILAELEQSLEKVERELGGDEELVLSQFSTYGQSGRSRGQNVASIRVRLTPSEVRTVRTTDIVKEWQRSVPNIAGVKRFSLRQRRGGPPGADIDILLQGDSPTLLKEAAGEVVELLRAVPGLSGAEDDLPYGKPEVIMELTPRGAALGFTIESIGQQVRNAFEGAIPRRLADGDDEVAIRVRQNVPEQGISALRDFKVRASSESGAVFVPLNEVVKITEQQGFATIQRRDGKVTVSVTADLDDKVATPIEVVDELRSSGELQALSTKYGFTYRFAGKDEERAASFADLQVGIVVALAVIYIILAWVFGSYAKPFAVMLIIPFGIVGAVVGHYLLGFKLTILSLVGLLGLSGILVNDSIILVTRFIERQSLGESVAEAAKGASRDRLRAVLLTSLSTIGGLTPLMFEKSLQAQFLLPMAITIVFGLAFATLLVLFLVPALLGVGDDIGRLFRAIFSDGSGRQDRLEAAE